MIQVDTNIVPSLLLTTCQKKIERRLCRMS